jgi:hypothetical protein
MVTYLLSESTDGWVLYDDEGRTALLRGDLDTVLLDAAKVMRENNDPVNGGWTVVPDTEVRTMRFFPPVGHELSHEYEIHPIVRPRLRRILKCVQHTHAERRKHRRLNFFHCHPTDFTRLRGRASLATGWPTAVHQRDNSMRQILIDASQPLDGDLKPGLFQNFAANTGLKRLIKFEHTAWSLPVTVVVALDDQHAVVVADHNAGDADRVFWCGCHAQDSSEADSISDKGGVVYLD